MTQPPAEVIELAERRLHARATKDFAASDELRAEIADAGWLIADAADSYTLSPKPPFSQFANINELPDRTSDSATADACVTLILDGWPEDVRTCVVALLQHTASDVEIMLLDLGNVDGVGLVAEEFAAAHPQRITAIHVAQTLQQAGWGAARNALLKMIPTRVQVIMDLSTVLDGDSISPLVAAISGEIVAAGWRGVNVNLADEWRSFDDASAAGEVDAVLSYLLAVDRQSALQTPINTKAKFYRNADLEWSLALRASGGKIVMPLKELPCHQARHRGYHDSEPEFRDRESKKTYDRLLQSFRGKTTILAPRS